MGLHDGVKTKVEKGFTYLEEFEIKNGILYIKNSCCCRCCFQ